jgi:hypothetical protein
VLIVSWADRNRLTVLLTDCREIPCSLAASMFSNPSTSTRLAALLDGSLELISIAITSNCCGFISNYLFLGWSVDFIALLEMRETDQLRRSYQVTQYEVVERDFRW